MLTLKSNTGRLVSLRPPTVADTARMYEYSMALAQEDTYLLLNPASPPTLKEEEEYVRSVVHKIHCHWEVMYLVFDQSKLVGSTSVVVSGRRKMHCGAIGLSLLPDYRHDGLGEQILRCILNAAKDQLHLSLVTLELFSRNEIAHHLYAKMGFVEYGRLPGGLQYKDGFQDLILMYRPL